MKDIVSQRKETMSIDLELVTIEEMLKLLNQYQGYVDSESRTLELYVKRSK